MISVIVPVYNVEKYLSDCIQSIVNQSFKDIEVILVDDGSTDNSGKICDDWSKYDSRIVVVHKKNGGLSSARNAGLEVAHGNYISFVDSDDIVDANFLQVLHSTITSNNVKVAACGVYSFYDYAPEHKKPFMNVVDGLMNNHQYVERILKHRLDNAVWNKIYLREAIGQLRFREGIINEDFPFIVSLMKSIEKIAFTKRRLYFYRKREGSITRKLHPRSGDYVNNALWFKNHMYSKFQFKNPKVVDSYIYQEMIGLLGALVKNGSPISFQHEYQLCYTSLINNFWKIMTDPNVKLKQRFKLFLLVYFPIFFQ